MSPPEVASEATWSSGFLRAVAAERALELGKKVEGKRGRGVEAYDGVDLGRDIVSFVAWPRERRGRASERR